VIYAERVMNGNIDIPGYEFGSPSVPRSPVSLEELRALEQACGFDANARDQLRKAAGQLTRRAEDLVDKWRSVIAEHPEMRQVFFGPDGQPDEAYKAAVKKRFVRWVVDVCEREHNQDWLDYQEEIGERHTPAKKNQTDAAHTASVVPLRYLIAFSAVVSTTIQQILEEGGYSSVEIAQIRDAWTKSMLLHLALWARPYVAASLW
jgi:Protoglobin